MSQRSTWKDRGGVGPDAPIAEQLDFLAKGSVDLIERGDLGAKLERSRKSGQPITIKVGFDPTAPDLHLGHTVVIRKMRHFQQLGHRVVFVIGDFTGMIGDPTGKKVTRPALTREEIEANAETYRRQIFKILDPVATEVRFNAEWLSPLGAEGMIRLAARYTLARMLERDDFRRRWDTHQPIALHELLYPLAQGYDSVALRADVELGGTDQLFNLLVGRDLMREYDLEPQVVLTVPLLEGLDGVEKMSKSLGNYVGIDEPASEIFGKIMSISDVLMWKYYLLCTDLTPAEIAAKRASVESGALHPMEAKRELARSITADFHSAEEAGRAEAEFRRVFSSRELPAAIEEKVLPPSAEPVPLARLLVSSGLAPSGSEAKRLVAQGGVSIDDRKLDDPAHAVDASSGREYLLKVGRRKFLRIRFFE
ncbi:MAG TPA: tyrosine--tRNA ligase [Thermoanaerobaculia bacterium]|nr:tyrosine--tRNA ligase [Thermoanaerobaculia bacterium]